MALEVREMLAAEADFVVDYHTNATPEYLDMLGVDPTRLPSAHAFRERLHHACTLPLAERPAIVVIWLSDGKPVGFSTADKIRRGEQANMHLHVTVAEQRQQGIGVACVRRSADLYFDRLQLKRLYCEPNAFNVAPNRTLQKAGFKYLKTHMTVPGPFNFHQPVTRWVIER
jgi:RimJ/RimL family protein N-acetyltransferase